MERLAAALGSSAAGQVRLDSAASSRPALCVCHTPMEDAAQCLAVVPLPWADAADEEPEHIARLATSIVAAGTAEGDASPTLRLLRLAPAEYVFVCRSVDTALCLTTLARRCGFDASGLRRSEPDGRTTCAVQAAAHRLDIPLSAGGAWLVTPAFVQFAAVRAPILSRSAADSV